MLFSSILLPLALAVRSVLGAPKPAELADRSGSCGPATLTSSVPTLVSLQKDSQCHTLSDDPQNALDGYNIAQGCTCFFYYNAQCDGNFVGWKGPQAGGTSHQGLVAYYCRDSKDSDD